MSDRRKAFVENVGIYIHVFWDTDGDPATSDPSVGYDDALEALADAVADGCWAARHSLRYSHTIIDKRTEIATVDMTDALAAYRRDEAEEDADRRSLQRAYPR